MKKHILILLIAAILAAVLSGCGANEDYALQIAELQAQIEELSARVEQLEQRFGLKTWELTASAWNSNNGATVTLTAVPTAYEQGQSAQFFAILDGQEIDRAECAWDGEKYTASLDLTAFDGYGYYCLITAPDGTRDQVALSTPDNLVNDAVVNLKTALSAYCNMIVEAWEENEGSLTITSGYVQVQLPRITAAGDAAALTGAELVLERSGQEVSRRSLSLPEGEGENSYEQVITDAAFDIPAMEDEQQLDLYLVVHLSDGTELTTVGCSWFCNGGELFLVVG